MPEEKTFYVVASVTGLGTFDYFLSGDGGATKDLALAKGFKDYDRAKVFQEEHYDEYYNIVVIRITVMRENSNGDE